MVRIKNNPKLMCELTCELCASRVPGYEGSKTRILERMRYFRTAAPRGRAVRLARTAGPHVFAPRSGMVPFSAKCQRTNLQNSQVIAPRQILRPTFNARPNSCSFCFIAANPPDRSLLRLRKVMRKTRAVLLPLRTTKEWGEGRGEGLH